MSFFIQTSISSSTTATTTAAPKPVIADINVINVHEDQMLQEALATIVCKDTTAPDGKCPECNVINWRPRKGTNTFDVWRKSTSTEFQLYYVAGVAGRVLDYEVIRSYFVDVRCRAWDKVTSVTKTVEIDVHPNEPPAITDWPLKDITIDVQNPKFPIGIDRVYKVVATDPEKDPLTYTMYTDVDNVDFFTITTDGDILVTKDLKTSTVENIPLKVNISDGRSTVGPFTVNVRLINVNKRPQITNLPKTVTLFENAKKGTLISSLSIVDDHNVITFPNTKPCTAIPKSEDFKFEYNPGINTITLAGTLDAETTNYYNISCVVNDGYLDSVGEYIELHVLNVNEPPQFNEPVYSCSMYESKPYVSGCDLGMILKDPENDPIVNVYLSSTNLPGSYNNNNGVGYQNKLLPLNRDWFWFDEKTRRLHFAVDYDIDNSNYPTSGLLTIEAVDDKGATGTSQIQVNIADVNDNAPRCDTLGLGTQLGNNYMYEVVQGDKTGHLGTVSASDDDRTAPNNEITLTAIGQSSKHVTAYDSGAIIYANTFDDDPDVNHKTSQFVYIEARDNGAPVLSSTCKT
ncbi:cadherin-23-like [Gigantopelta aegis]|uniref:cadherin-23-like n=1 Tax=Gigantopelta aegis TaxID=1735272 RepID=UPI001B88D939|nr:cadherin-23-like [Gigantopelta aegis]